MAFLPDPFFTGQTVGLLIISGVLLGIHVLILIKGFKVNRYVGVLVSMLAIYLFATLFLRSVTDLGWNASPQRDVAWRGTEVTQAINFMRTSLMIWAAFDLAILSLRPESYD